LDLQKERRNKIYFKEEFIHEIFESNENYIAMLNTNFWKKYFAVYDFLNVLEPYQKLLAAFVEAFGDVRGKKILDAGAGTGNLAALLEKCGAKVVGLDFSKEGLEIFKKKLPNSQTIFHDLTKPLPFPDKSFDAVVSNNTIYTLPLETRPAVFKEFFRVLKPNGKIVVSNVREGWKPLTIYLAHIRWSIREKGFIKTIADILHLLIPTLKIFYYNFLIQKENRNHAYSFIKSDEHRALLQSAGFSNISENLFVYANQAILNLADK